MEKQSSITTYNPENGEKLANYPLHTTSEIDDLLADSFDAYLEWKTTAMPLRMDALKSLAEVLLREKESLALLMTKEMGKTHAEGIAEIEKCAYGALYYAEQGPAQLAPIEIKTEARRSFVCFEPIGPVLAIMPWNFPFWQVVRCAAPSLLVGNTVVLKHASNVMGCALALEKIFAEATKHENFFRTVVVSGQDALPLIARP